MSEVRNVNRCPRCGTDVAADASGGLCTRCLLATAERATDDPGSRQPGMTPPGVDEVAAAFPQLEIVERIGVGGMGTVFKARQPKLDRWVALKILSEAVAGDLAFGGRFLREARVLARLNHPNIVTVYDFGQSGRYCYLLMEYVDGVNLRQAMRAAKFAPAQALSLVPQICEALQFAHDRGVTHRDIKPENILLDARGQVKLADFGIAKLIGESGGGPSLTMTGTAVGTPQYMAPEQIEKPAAVDHRADIYSLGVVFYELLTGELPLGRFAAPSSKTPLDARVDEIVLRALAKERELRQQTASEFRSEVEGLRGDPSRQALEGASTPTWVAPLWQASGSYQAVVLILAWLLVGMMLAVGLPASSWFLSRIEAGFRSGWFGGLLTLLGLIGMTGTVVLAVRRRSKWLGPLWPPTGSGMAGGTGEERRRGIGIALSILAVGLAWNLFTDLWSGALLLLTEIASRGHVAWAMALTLSILPAGVGLGLGWLWRENRRRDLHEPTPMPAWSRRTAAWLAVVCLLAYLEIWRVRDQHPETVVTMVLGMWVLPSCLALWTRSRWWRAVALVAGGFLMIQTMLGAGFHARFLWREGGAPGTEADSGMPTETRREATWVVISQLQLTFVFGLSLWTLVNPAVRSSFGLRPRGARIQAGSQPVSKASDPT